MKSAAGVTCLLLAICIGVCGLYLWQSNGVELYSIHTDWLGAGTKPGDLMLNIKSDDSSVGSGDIVAYRSAEDAQTITIRRASELSYSDKLHVVSKTFFVVPLAGYIFDFLRRPAVMIAFVYLPALLIVSAQLKRLLGHYKSSQYRIARYL